jgi:hypothetical protein
MHRDRCTLEIADDIWASIPNLIVASQVCLVCALLVFSLAILPEIGSGDWQRVRCRVAEAERADSASPVGALGRFGSLSIPTALSRCVHV